MELRNTLPERGWDHRSLPMLNLARLFAGALATGAILLLSGCAVSPHPVTPVKAGLNTRDLIDPTAQADADRLTDADGLLKSAGKLRELARPAVLPPKKSVLCLSGGG